MNSSSTSVQSRQASFCLPKASFCLPKEGSKQERPSISVQFEDLALTLGAND